MVIRMPKRLKVMAIRMPKRQSSSVPEGLVGLGEDPQDLEHDGAGHCIVTGTCDMS